MEPSRLPTSVGLGSGSVDEDRFCKWLRQLESEEVATERG